MFLERESRAKGNAYPHISVKNPNNNNNMRQGVGETRQNLKWFNQNQNSNFNSHHLKLREHFWEF